MLGAGFWPAREPVPRALPSKEAKSVFPKTELGDGGGGDKFRGGDFPVSESLIKHAYRDPDTSKLLTLGHKIALCKVHAQEQHNQGIKKNH